MKIIYFFLFTQLCTLNTFAIEPSHPETLEEISVIGKKSKASPLDIIPTVTQLSGSELNRKKQTTLGETLGAELGVRSSFYGPNSSRPVIRGLEGDRVRILQNGMGVLDASGASQDHAVTIDPFTIERLEVLRGSAALLYGSQAIGGVVNVVSNRLPERLVTKPEIKTQYQTSSVDLGRTFMLSSDTRVGQWAQHVDLSQNRVSDYKTSPGETKINNSWNHIVNGAVGTSYIDEQHLVGASFSQYESDYGTVAEPTVYIKMKQQRGEVVAEKKNLGWAQSIRLKSVVTRYQHKEIDNEQIGTTFKNGGNETRLEIKHRPIGLINGTLGYHYNQFKFEVTGDEAFLPTTNNNTHSIFGMEEVTRGNLTLNIGARVEGNKVDNQKTHQQKSFLGNSTSAGFIYRFNDENNLALNSTYTERAPNYQELFANGQHMATGTFQVGDQNLAKEKGSALELSFRHKKEKSQGLVNTYLQRFDDFIFMAPTGVNDAGTGLPIYQYEKTKAKFYGIEAQYSYRFMDLFPVGFLEVTAKGEIQRGENSTTNTSLPRMSPMRETLTLSYKTDHFNADLDLQRTERQNKLASSEASTNGYTMTHLNFAYHGHVKESTYSLFLRFRNVFNVEAKNHLSLLKDRAPLPGRNVITGIQFFF